MAAGFQLQLTDSQLQLKVRCPNSSNRMNSKRTLARTNQENQPKMHVAKKEKTSETVLTVSSLAWYQSFLAPSGAYTAPLITVGEQNLVIV